MGLSVLSPVGVADAHNEQAALVKALRGIYQNQRVLAEAIGVELPFTEGELLTPEEPRSRASEVLPPALRQAMLDERAFEQAFAKGYIEVADKGQLCWRLDSNTLLAYFLGRLFCGDSAKWSRRKEQGMWMQGERAFPASALSRVFGVKHLKELRKNRLFSSLPQHHTWIDQLFEGTCGEQRGNGVSEGRGV